MTLWGIFLSAEPWLAPMTALAVVGLLAAAILLRDHFRLERYILTLEADVERLKGEVRHLTAGGARDGTIAIGDDTSAGAPPIRRDLPGPALETQEGRAAGWAAPAGEAGLSLTGAVVQNKDPEPAKSLGRVLLVEDDEVNALLAIKSVERAGALIDWARDGHEGYRLIEASFAGAGPAYDVVLMDMRMPRLDGLEATRQIRALEARCNRAAPLRIVALTATAMRQDRLAAQAAGVDAFLPKPYRAEALVKLLMRPSDELSRAS
jgi:CheY-like chemotaxis protein